MGVTSATVETGRRRTEWVTGAVERWARADGGLAAGLDLALVLTTMLAAFTDEVVFWFHIVFVLLAAATLFLDVVRLRRRILIWVPVVTVIVARAAWLGATERSELIEIPLLTAILVIVYLAARRRSDAVVALTLVNADLEEQARIEHEHMHERLDRIQQLEGACRASLSIAHDLNNVINALLDGSEDLVGQLDGRNALTTAEELLESSQRARVLMDEFTGYARQPDLGLGESDLNAVIREMHPMLRRLTRRGTALEVDLRSTDPAVPVDRGRLGQILANLVANASDAIDGDGTIRIETRDALAIPAGGGGGAELSTVVLLTITDDGHGIPTDALPRIFEPDYTTKSEGRNLGMGLVSVRSIVEAAGGSIEVGSLVGTGTTFRIEFPRAADAIVMSRPTNSLTTLPPTGDEVN